MEKEGYFKLSASQIKPNASLLNTLKSIYWNSLKHSLIKAVWLCFSQILTALPNFVSWFQSLVFYHDKVYQQQPEFLFTFTERKRVPSLCWLGCHKRILLTSGYFLVNLDLGYLNLSFGKENEICVPLDLRVDLFH